ncbi:MAG: hypothetical protein KGZ96_12590 [Clostridia bacterium]|nr:hypothetical protein [Clostridia bacterium]
MISITKKQEQLSAAILGFIILILLVGVGWYYFRISWEIKQLEDRIAITMEKRAQIKEEYLGEDLLRAEDELNRVYQELSFLEDPVILLRSLERLTQETNVEIGFFRPMENSPGEFKPNNGVNMPSALLEINLKGQWMDVILFYQLLDQLSPYLLTEELRLVAEGGAAGGMIKLRIFHPAEN